MHYRFPDRSIEAIMPYILAWLSVTIMQFRTRLFVFITARCVRPSVRLSASLSHTDNV